MSARSVVRPARRDTHTLAAVSPVASRRAAVAASLTAAVVAAVLITVVVIAPGGGGSGTRGPRPATTPSPGNVSPTQAAEFGASVNLLFNPPAGAGAEADVQLSALRATGATLARSDALWELSEPAPPV